MRFIILPGNGCASIRRSNWYAWLETELKKRGVEIAMQDMPDPYRAAESVWVDCAINRLKVDRQTVVVGHSSGACCALRLLEHTQAYGAILVSAAHTDLGDENERASGYFDRPWEWAKIRSNAKVFIHQFHSEDDHLIPVQEARYIADALGKCDTDTGGGTPTSQFRYEELRDHSHFFEPFSELLRVIDERLQEEREREQKE